MSHSASGSPLRKKQRLSSPSYDTYFAELDSDDFQALHDIEAGLSQELDKPITSDCDEAHIFDKIPNSAVVYNLENPGALLPDKDGTGRLNPAVSSHWTPSLSRVDLNPSAPCLTKDPAPYNSSADHATDFISVAPLATHSTDTDPSTHMPNLLSLEMQPKDDLDLRFASSKTSFSTGFASASAFELDPTIVGRRSTFAFNRASGKAWMPPSSTALEAARIKVQAWEAEIESELTKLDKGADMAMHNPLREPLKDLENSAISLHTATSDVGPVSADDSRPKLPMPFKPPAFTAPLHNRTINLSNAHQSVISHTNLARNSASAPVPTHESSHKTTLSTSAPPLAPAFPQINSSIIASKSVTALPQTAGGTPQRAKPLGLTPRAHAFTSSKARPKFVTPFKRGALLGERSGALSYASHPKVHTRPEFNREDDLREVEQLHGNVIGKDSGTTDTGMNLFDLAKSSNRRTLVDCGLTPQSFTIPELTQMGFDANLFHLPSVSSFVYYRFNPSGADASGPIQGSLGADTAFNELLASGCKLATKAWVDNHWSLILWKTLGMSCLDPTSLGRKWCWTEVIRQLRHRYMRELMNGERPALRLITTQDAPASAPLVLCVSDVFWTDEYIDTDGQLVPAHPELELTDGWYRLRATVDETLARATRNRKLRVGRKISCSGTKLESSKKDPMEVLDAYRNVHLLLSGNSTHLAEWHTKLGFKRTPFVATLGSLSPDGGTIPLMDLSITQVLPVGYVEYSVTDSGQRIHHCTRTEQEEAQEDEKWRERRANEAMKLRDEIEKKLQCLESYAEKLERIAGCAFQPTDDDSPPGDIDDLIEELENSEDPASLMKGIMKTDAGWLAQSLRKKCEADRENIGDNIDRELSASFPPRHVRNFCVLRVRDARAIRKASTRIAQLTVWDVMSLKMAEDCSAGSFTVGQRYMVTNLTPNQPSAWMGLEPGDEVFLSAGRNSKWKFIR